MSRATYAIVSVLSLTLFAATGCAETAPNSAATARPGNEEMNAPLILNLRGPEPIQSSGDIRLDLEIVVNSPLRAPATLQILLPQGVSLVSGQPSELLQLQQTGKLFRQFVVRSPSPLSAPIRVVADVSSPNGAFGIHAERSYPAAAQPQINQPQRPPTGRPSGPPR